jgi:hypothetical protein
MDAELTLSEAVQRARELTAAEAEGFENDDPVCEWCGVLVPDGASAYAPYCSEQCQHEQRLDEAIALGIITPEQAIGLEG